MAFGSKQGPQASSRVIGPGCKVYFLKGKGSDAYFYQLQIIDPLFIDPSRIKRIGPAHRLPG
jgi:hypothetical protein